MKGVPIKFRGKSVITGGYVYGDLIHGFDDEGKYSENVTWIVFNNELNEISRVKIYPDSISQLCGYDADGKEIYEGDELEASNPDYAAIIPCHKVLSPYDGKFSLKGLSDFDIATWNIRLKGDKK